MSCRETTTWPLHLQPQPNHTLPADLLHSDPAFALTGDPAGLLTPQIQEHMGEVPLLSIGRAACTAVFGDESLRIHSCCADTKILMVVAAIGGLTESLQKMGAAIAAIKQTVTDAIPKLLAQGGRKGAVDVKLTNAEVSLLCHCTSCLVPDVTCAAAPLARLSEPLRT